jgi:branched-chain amino acid aminotransferase
MFAFINNKFLEEKDAQLQVGDLAIQRGYGVFDYFRTRNYVPLFLADYLERFFKSARGLRLELPYAKDEITKIVDELIKKNNIPEAGFRIILTGGYSPDNFHPSTSNLIVLQQLVTLPTKQKFDKGLKIILHEYMRDLPGIKSINYLMGIYLQHKIQQQNADDVLYYKEDAILEFPRSNVFIVTQEQTVVTPSENVLHGITRMKVIELAHKHYKVEERPVSVMELKQAAEVFLTSTTKRILPVLQVDDLIIGNGKPGEVTRNLYNKFLEFEETFLSNLV